MKKSTKKLLSICLSLAVLATSFSANYSELDAKAKLSKTKMSLKVGNSKAITIKGKVKKAKYTFTSSKKAVATVNSKGVVKAKKAGTATITVKEKLKKKIKKVGKVKVTVKAITPTNTPANTPKPTDEVVAVMTPTPVPSVVPTATAAPTSSATKRPTPTKFPEDPEFKNIPNGYTQTKAANQGEVKKFEFKTTTYYEPNNPAPVKAEVTRYALVVLPKDYSTDKKYPVVYVMHGYSDSPEFMVVDHKDTNVIWNGAANKDFKEVIAVYPQCCCNADGKSSFATMNVSTPAFDYVINEMIDVLMPLIEKNFSVLTGRENTAICGFSMGGRETFNIGFRHPELFGGIGGFCPASGAFDGGDMLTKDQLTLDDKYKDNTYIQITKGAKDTVVNNSPVDYDKLFTQKGIPHTFYETMGGDPAGSGEGGHWRQVWQHGLYNFLKRTFPVDK